MILSNEVKESAVDDVLKKMYIFLKSNLKNNIFLDAMIQQMITLDGAENVEDLLPQLIDHSSNSRVIFRALQRIAADMISSDQELRAELKLWLIDILKHEKTEPKEGRTGPNKSILEQSFLIGIVNSLRDKTGLPVWPRFSQAQHGSVLDLVALASKRFKEVNNYSPFPTKVFALEKRYIIARKQVLGKTPEKI